MPTASNSNNSANRVFGTPRWQRYLSLFGVVFLGATTLFLAVFAALVLLKKIWLLGLFMLAVAAFVGALTGYVLKDLRGRWGLRIELLDDAAKLDLPAARSLVHRPKAQHLTVPYRDIEAVESRLEAFRTLGMAMMQCPYVLKLKSGGTIFLFEDRALATDLSQPIYAPIAEAIAKRANIPLRRLGMVEGDGGVLAVWGTGAPDWSAPPLPAEQQMRLWRHAAATGSFAALVVVAAFVLGAVFKW